MKVQGKISTCMIPFSSWQKWSLEKQKIKILTLFLKNVKMQNCRHVSNETKNIVKGMYRHTD
ncbi:MAG: hypothetical protein JWO53_1315 [Chlamydiia bacterium]|nr:hypothetical protein [Chlamydiia bacterium]